MLPRWHCPRKLASSPPRPPVCAKCARKLGSQQYTLFSPAPGSGMSGGAVATPANAFSANASSANAFHPFAMSTCGRAEKRQHNDAHRINPESDLMLQHAERHGGDARNASFFPLSRPPGVRRELSSVLGFRVSKPPPPQCPTQQYPVRTSTQFDPIPVYKERRFAELQPSARRGGDALPPT